MQLERLFTYDDWANREEVARLRQLPSAVPALRLLGHIIGAEWLWITRIRNESAKLAVWPELTLEQCAAELDLLRAAWREILQNVERESKIDYRNSKGEVWSSSVDDILMHVAMHGAYHRGQIATVVRTGSGETPAYTDYIHAVRTSAI
ncbi:MAG TPA: DinB family protein [Thermoanaerobaculia bacterium]